MKREIPILISLSVALSAFCTPIRSFAAVSPAQSAEVRERNNRAALLQKRHIFAQAVEEYNKCLEIDPTNQVVRRNLALALTDWGSAYFNQKKYPEAQQAWLDALKIEPNLPSPRHNLQVLDQTCQRLGIQIGGGGDDGGPPDAAAADAPPPDDAAPPERKG